MLGIFIPSQFFDFFLWKFQKLEIPLKARIAIGSLTLKPSKFKFRPSFPVSTIYNVDVKKKAKRILHHVYF